MNKKNIKITIIGSGALGTALGKVLYDGGIENISIYGVVEEEINELKKGLNTNYFPNSTNLPTFSATTNINHALTEADYVVLAVPSNVINLVLADILGSLDHNILIISGSKGFYPGTDLSIHEGLVEATKNNNFIRGVVSLIGPSHAEEIVMELPTIVSAVAKKAALAMEVQSLFHNKYFKTYVQTDVKGSETGAAYKNVLAIASGIANQLGYGINAHAALLTRGIAEMQRFNKVMKGKPQTIMGLTGIGDLIVTATSDLSRNYVFGKEFAQHGQKALETKKTVEGLSALKIIYNIAQNKKIDLPIVDFLYKSIYGKQDIKKLVNALWKRSLKFE